MIPKHIAIIMDGNGRWAKKHNLPRILGHREGIERIKEIIKACRELGVGVLTIFTFSTENWQRPRKEVNTLMKYLGQFLRGGLRDLHKNGIRLRAIGRRDRIPVSLKKLLDQAIRQTAANTNLTLNLALDYGSRYEILDAARSIAREALNGKLSDVRGIDEEYFSRRLWTAGLPDPDLLIRTSGEQRISNFMLWQLSYTELYFSRKFWPDFHRRDLERAIRVFNLRQRRFGRIDEPKEND
ncbi:MAG: isoprenyl transferase [Candidatus Omnitrophota bacterium]